MSTKNRYDNVLSVPSSAESFIKASEDRSKAHSKAGTDIVATSIRMSKATHMRLKLAAVTEGTSITEIIDTAVNMYLDGINSRKEVDDEDGL